MNCCSLSCYPSARALPSSCRPNISWKNTQPPRKLDSPHDVFFSKITQVKTSAKHPLWPEKTTSVAIQIGAILAAVEQPALAVTGVNNQEDLQWVLIQIGIIAFWYFLIMPPIILNWLRLRWYKRMLLEMYLQFMFMFIFFPGVLLWAPFVNFRRLPRDPTMKYPWSTPQDPSLTDSQSP